MIVKSFPKNVLRTGWPSTYKRQQIIYKTSLSPMWILLSYRVMQTHAQRAIAIVMSGLSVRMSDCNVEVPWSYELG